MTTKQLLDEFNKKINSQDNYNTNCLGNISMASVIPCIKLVNKITQSQLDIHQQEIEIKDVFVNMLKSDPLSNAIIQNFEMLIILKLKYSQEKQKIKGIYTTSIDYNAKDERTIEFFKVVQNKLLWAICQQTAAELVYRRADAS